MITLNSLSKIYRTDEIETVALENVNLTVERGEFLSIMGPSGCGKSTLLNIMGLLDAPTMGMVEINGIRTEGMKDKELAVFRNKTLGFVFQSFHLINSLNVMDNVELPLLYRRMAGSERKRLAQEVLEKVGLSHRMRHFPTQLSGGQCQRVAIARAIINQPRVVLLDEPLSALDLKLRTEMQYELRELQKRLGITFVFVTHDQEEALAMSDWIFVMNDGEIVQSGTPVDIYDEPINHFVATFIGESNILPGVMIEDYLVEFNGKRFESVDGGMRPNEPIEVVIRPEDLQITLPEEGKLQVRVETQLFRGVHYEIIAYDNLGNEWMIHSTRKAIEGEIIGLDFTPEDIHIMRLNETEEEFDARIEEYVEMEEPEDGLINAIEEERHEENS